LTHILLYTNNIEDALSASKYIDHIINTDGRYKIHKFIYNNCLHSRSTCNVKEELEKFKKSQFGIISCVYLFGEGFDMPELNGVCVAANMHSETRIIQYLLRPNRLNPLLPSKKASIILPLQRNEENILTSNIVQIIREFSDADPGVLNKIIINCDDQTQINVINAEVMITLAKGGILNYSIEEAEYKRAKAINLTYNIHSKYNYSREYKKLNFARILI
jgi:superfamily II DNA or RNA helicase